MLAFDTDGAGHNLRRKLLDFLCVQRFLNVLISQQTNNLS